MSFTSLGSILPSPTSTNVPAIILKKKKKKPFPVRIIFISSFSLTTFASYIILTLDFELVPLALKALKSCSPIKYLDASFILFSSNFIG